ncbi:MAG: 30S ribosomal protein S19e [Candidatus Norongarragalinales archaeon]
MSEEEVIALLSSLDVSADKLIARVADELKKNEAIKAPEWLLGVKSGVHAERPIADEDFWFKRCASLLRTLHIHGNKGVRRLRHKYGGRQRHVVHSPHHKPGSGKIIRTALQQLEKAGLVKKEKTGRVISPRGVALLDKAAAAVAGK